MLSDEYKPVTSRYDSMQVVHAAWIEGSPDKTMCGQVESLDFVQRPNYVVSCTACRGALKKIRQQRSREGTARHQERMRQQREQVEEATAGYEGAPELGPDMVWVPTEEIDRLLVNTMRMRAVSLRQEGFPTLALELETVAQRLGEHAQIPDDTSVPEPPPAALSETKYTGQERRHRPRMIEPTPGDEL